MPITNANNQNNGNIQMPVQIVHVPIVIPIVPPALDANGFVIIDYIIFNLDNLPAEDAAKIKKMQSFLYMKNGDDVERAIPEDDEWLQSQVYDLDPYIVFGATDVNGAFIDLFIQLLNQGGLIKWNNVKNVDLRVENQMNILTFTCEC